MGAVRAVTRGLRGAQVTIVAKRVLDGLAVGDSLTVNGACLTAVARTETEFRVDISSETLDVTNLGALHAGDAVNLERALRFDARLGGHLVTGHIDGVGTVRSRRPDGETLMLVIDAGPEVLRYCIRKGSIAVEGVSLTINAVGDRDVAVAIIPHTAQVTTLGLKGPGAVVNLEADLIGKYVERLLSADRSSAPARPRVDPEFLKRKGML